MHTFCSSCARSSFKRVSICRCTASEAMVSSTRALTRTSTRAAISSSSFRLASTSWRLLSISKSINSLHLPAVALVTCYKAHSSLPGRRIFDGSRPPVARPANSSPGWLDKSNGTALMMSLFPTEHLSRKGLVIALPVVHTVCSCKHTYEHHSDIADNRHPRETQQSRQREDTEALAVRHVR